MLHCNWLMCEEGHLTVHYHWFPGSGVACWLECHTRDRQVASSNHSWSDGRIFSSRVNFVCWLLFGVRSTARVTAVARKRPRLFCQKCRYQVTPKHAYTFDPMKSEWADYAAVQAQCGNLSGNELTRNSSGNCINTFQYHLIQIVGARVPWNVVAMQTKPNI